MKGKALNLKKNKYICITLIPRNKRIFLHTANVTHFLFPALPKKRELELDNNENITELVFHDEAGVQLLVLMSGQMQGLHFLCDIHIIDYVIPNLNLHKP